MGQKNRMKIWQMVIILVLAAGILSTMFLPIYKVDGDAVVSMLQKANDKVKDDLDFGALGSLVSDLVGKFLEDQKEEFDKKIEEYEEEKDIKISSITPFEIMTHSAQSFFGTEEDEEEEGKKEGDKDKKEDKKGEGDKDKKEDKKEGDKKEDKEEGDKKEDGEEEDQSLESRLEDSYTKVRVILWIVYVMAFVVMAIAILGTVLKLPKYLPLAVSAAYSVGAMAAFGVGKFLSPSVFADNISKAEGLFDMGIFAEADKVFGEGLRQAVLAEWITGKMFSGFVGIGFSIGLIFAALLFVISIVSMFVGGRQEAGAMQGSQGVSGTGGMPINQRVSGTGGMPVNQGSSGTGGMPVNQGSSGTGGMPINQGASGAGGMPVNQGISGTGGMPVNQRASGTGGMPVNQGSSGTGGMPVNQWAAGTGGMPVDQGASSYQGMPGTGGMPGMQQPVAQAQQQVQPAAGMGQVTCTKGVAQGKGFSLPQDRKVVVGRNERNANLIISYPKISNVHCSIRYVAAANTYIVKDHSTNGTFVNGIRLRKDVGEELPAGSVLQLADGANEITLG